MTAMPILTTDRLIIRPFELEDLDFYHRMMNDAFGETPLEDHRAWIEWAVRSYPALAALYQPPYGDRAVIHRDTGTLVGSVGIVPCMGPFDRLPYWRERSSVPPTGLFTAEFGLFWAIETPYRRQGYAVEATQAVIDYLFDSLTLQRVIATTEFSNEASQAVMRKLGMRIERSTDPEPPWFQVVGVLDNPRLKSAT
jgi:RimJ/RimL family protein N-acetyltransferase